MTPATVWLTLVAFCAACWLGVALLVAHVVGVR